MLMLTGPTAHRPWRDVSFLAFNQMEQGLTTVDHPTMCFATQLNKVSSKKAHGLALHFPAMQHQFDSCFGQDIHFSSQTKCYYYHLHCYAQQTRTDDGKFESTLFSWLWTQYYWVFDTKNKREYINSFWALFLPKERDP